MNTPDNTQFPQYRKLSNGKNFYKICSPKLFEEIQLVGNLKRHYVIEANQYPEMLRIQDMLSLEAPFSVVNEAEWVELYSLLK